MEDGEKKNMKPNCKPEKVKGTNRGKVRSEESASDLLTDINENELHDDDDSGDGDYFADRDLCLI